MASKRTHKVLLLCVLLLLAGLGLYLRTSGLYRGLGDGYAYHPDEPKQILALSNFLRGRYVWYTGSHFYDGYPYGLNHVDEWIMRPILLARVNVSRHMHDEGRDRPDVIPDKASLYHWARGLRVMYGMVCLILAYFISKKLLFSRAESLCVVFLLCVAPLSVGVAHFASGDIGVDLFTCLTMLFLCFYADKPRPGLIFFAGLCTGAAFACKYNGALGGIVVAVYVIGSVIRDRAIRRFLISGIMAVTGFVAGAIILTPALLINWHRSWHDIRDNFKFIKDYGASQSFLAKPLFERICVSMGKNVPRIIDGMGWFITILALLAVIIVGIQLFRKRDERKVSLADNGNVLLRWSVFVYPFLALLISLTGKPVVHPFHFSYLQLPLILGGVYSIFWLRDRLRPAARTIALVLLSCVIFEFCIRVEREHFFWKLEDNLHFADKMRSEIFFDDHEPDGGMGEGIVKTIFLEPENPVIFRNRRKHVVVQNADFWNCIGIAPVPGIPYPVEHDWIFMNGPVFPRNDRMFHAGADTMVSKYIVFHSEPAGITVGVRSGAWPVSVKISVGGVRNEMELTPNSQKIIDVPVKKWRYVSAGKSFDKDVFIVPIEVNAGGGDLWVTVMKDRREIEMFGLFGGDGSTGVPSSVDWISEKDMVENIGRARFIESEVGRIVMLNARDPGNSGALLLFDDTVLACGAYVLECDVIGLSDRAEIILEEMGVTGFEDGSDKSVECVITRGLQTVRVPFAKTFAPYEFRIRLICLAGTISLQSWRLTPDTARMLADFKAWKADGRKPLWLNRFPANYGVPVPDRYTGIMFGESFKLTHFVFPEKIDGNESARFYCGLNMNGLSVPDMDKNQLFVHLVDEQGNQVHVASCSVSDGMIGAETLVPLSCSGVSNLTAGKYQVKIGMWDTITGARLPISGKTFSSSEVKENRIHVGETMIIRND